MTDQAFEGQAAVVTGAGEGIGYEIARQLALRGSRVLLNDIDAERAQQAAEKIRFEGGDCQALAGDVSQVEVVRDLVAEAVGRFGRLDIAVANAGITSWGSFFDYTPQDFDTVLGVNLRGSYFLAQAAARRMREQGQGGRIMLISSVTGHQALENLSAYAMTKAALEMMARNLVLELGPHGITINAVAPGATVTPRTLREEENYEADWQKMIPNRRVAYPEDITHAVLFFLSDAARHITGQALVVDGGWTCYSPVPAAYQDEDDNEDNAST